MAARVGSVSIFGPAKATGAVIALESVGLDALSAEAERLCTLLVLWAHLVVPVPEADTVEGLGICEVERCIWLIEVVLAVAEVLVVYCARLELLRWNELVDIGRRSG